MHSQLSRELKHPSVMESKCALLRMFSSAPVGVSSRGKKALCNVESGGSCALRSFTILYIVSYIISDRVYLSGCLIAFNSEE